MAYDPNRPDYPSNNVGQDVDQIRENTNQLRAHEKGPVMPNNPVAGLIWADDSATELALKLRNKASSAFINIDSFPSGTKMVFCQAAAPIFWTQDITNNDKALRVVNTPGGGNGGSRVLSSVNIGDTTLTLTQIPSHNHGAIGDHSHNAHRQDGENSQPYSSLLFGSSTGTSDSWISGVISASGAHTHASEGGGQVHNHDLSLAYVDVIVCQKN